MLAPSPHSKQVLKAGGHVPVRLSSDFKLAVAVEINF